MMPPERSNYENSRSPDRLRAYAGLLGDVSTLITELEASQESRQSDNSFVFELFDDETVVIPPQVKAVMPTVEQIVVTIGKNSDPLPPTSVESAANISSYISVDFLSGDKIVTVSRSGDSEDKDQPDVLTDLSYSAKGTPIPFRLPTPRESINSELSDDFAARQTEIAKVPQADFNTLIMSLIYPDAERGYEMFNKVNLLRGEAYDSLKDSFKIPALNHKSSMTHRFSTDAVHFDFNKNEGQPVSFSIYYNEPVKIDGEIISGRPIVARSNLETDFKLEFQTYDVRLEQFEGKTKKGISVPLGSMLVESATPYFPTTEDIQALRIILSHEIAAINPATVELFEDEIFDGTTPEQTFESSGKARTIFSATYIQNMLDKLGFDSPNSGAA